MSASSPPPSSSSISAAVPPQQVEQHQQQQQRRRSSAANTHHQVEQNNNNNNNNSASIGPGRLTRKRSSVQSNMSSLANGSGHGSLHSHHSNSSQGSTSSCDDQDPAKPGGGAACSSADYERIRDTTLMFFLDRLYLASREGKEARTLHDLSCLFGTKEFTKEMRQIVGASRNGLKKFLQSYPSLFQIEEDKVFLTQLKQDPVTTQRDYNREAVDYFRDKMLQFGTSLVPIKNLFGYRSQAGSHLRHVSGKGTHDFKRFLRQNEDVFEILADEHVVLRSALAELESQGQTSLVLEQSLQPLPADEAIVTDPYLNKQFAHLVEQCIKSMRAQEVAAGCLESDQLDHFKVTLEQLHERIRAECQNELFLKMVRSRDDLRVFLRMHPKLFKRPPSDQITGPNEDYVCLLSEQERKQLQLASQAAALQRQQSNLERANSLMNAAAAAAGSDQKAPATPPAPVGGKAAIHAPSEKTTTTTTTSSSRQEAEPSSNRMRSLPPQVAAQTQSNNNNQRPANIATKLQDQTTTTTTTSNHSKSQNSNASQRGQLSAAAPPFVPSKPVSRQNSSLASVGRHHNNNNNNNNHHHQPHQHQVDQHANNLSGAGAGGRPFAGTQMHQRSQSNLSRSAHQQRQQQQDGRRGHQQVAPIDQRQAIRSYLTKSNPSNNMSWSGRREMAAPEVATQKAATKAAGPPPAPLSDSEMRARTVDIVREASNIISRIMNTADAVAFDCKGYNLGFDGQITLIQFGYLPTRHSDPIRSLELRASDHQAGGAGNAAATAALPSGAPKTKPEVCVFDLITNPELAYCLKPLLESDKIVKIVHDVRNKSNALYVQFKIILNNVFDTQVANLVIQQQDTGKPAYKSRYISTSKLCEIYGDDELMRYRNIIKHKTRHASGLQTSSGGSQAALRNSKDVNYWRTRPLTKPMIFEATMDVYCLVGGIYQNLKRRIKREYEPLFDQLNLEGVLARIKPEEIRSAKKERKIDLEVIDLKRKLYSDTMGPVVLSNREIRLLRHIDLTDEVRQKIQQCKKVAKKLERLDMKAAQLRGEQPEGGGASNDPNSSLTSASQVSSSSMMSNTAADELLQSLDCALAAGATSAHPSLASASAAEQQAQFDAKMDEFQATGLITNLMDSSMFDELKDKMIESSSLLESLEDDDDDVDQCAGAGGPNLSHLSSSGSHHSHNGHSSSGHDCCGCQCHRSSTDSGEPNGPKSVPLVEQQQPVGSAESEPVEVSPTDGDVAPAVGQQQTSSASDPLATETKKQTNDQSSSATPPVETETETSTTNASEPVGDNHEQATKLAPDDTTEKPDEDSDSKSSLACDMAVQCDLLS